MKNFAVIGAKWENGTYLEFCVDVVVKSEIIPTIRDFSKKIKGVTFYVQDMALGRYLLPNGKTSHLAEPYG